MNTYLDYLGLVGVMGLLIACLIGVSQTPREAVATEGPRQIHVCDNHGGVVSFIPAHIGYSASWDAVVCVDHTAFTGENIQ